MNTLDDLYNICSPPVCAPKGLTYHRPCIIIRSASANWCWPPVVSGTTWLWSQEITWCLVCSTWVFPGSHMNSHWLCFLQAGERPSVWSWQEANWILFFFQGFWTLHWGTQHAVSHGHEAVSSNSASPFQMNGSLKGSSGIYDYIFYQVKWDKFDFS